MFDQEHQHDSQWSAIWSLAEKIGCTSETLRHWVRQNERDAGRRPDAVWLYHRVPQSGNGRTQDASNHCPTSYRKDDGRPVEVGYQEQASNHLKRLSLRAAVVSVEETLSKTRQVWIRKTNVSKPLLTRREPEHDIETGGGWYLRDKSGGCPECRPGGVRRAGGVSLIQAFLWNCGNQSS